MLISYSKKLVFFHIPKTGGVSIRKTLKPYQDVGPENYQHMIKGRQPDNMHINQKIANTLYDLNGLTEFTLVREPLDRLISLYNYGFNAKLFESFDTYMKVVEKHYVQPSRYRQIYNSQLYWITDNTVILKLENVIKDSKSELEKINLSVTEFHKENDNKNIKYIPTIEESNYCLNFLNEEYIRLNYEIPTYA